MVDNGPPIPGYDRGGDGPPAPFCRECYRYHWYDCPPLVEKRRWEEEMRIGVDGDVRYSKMLPDPPGYACANCGRSTYDPRLDMRYPGHYFCRQSCADEGPTIARAFLDRALGGSGRRRRADDVQVWTKSEPADAPALKLDVLIEALIGKVEQRSGPKRELKADRTVTDPVAARFGELDFDDD